jgi:DNA-binding beta-propeller fold protein YncE
LFISGKVGINITIQRKRKEKIYMACRKLACLILLSLISAQHLSAQTDGSKGAVKKVIHDGIAVELEVEPLDAQKKRANTITEGDIATLRFTITDTNTGTRLGGLRPSSWMSTRRKDDTNDCSKKIANFLSGSLLNRPQLDFNAYYVLALNHDSTISVVDPLFHYGGTKLLALVGLNSPGEDWALTSDKAKLFVSLPDSNQVAVVDSRLWKLITNLNLEGHPTRISLQPDEQYLWVAYGTSSNEPRSSGVAVISVSDMKVAARIPTGRGHHEIAFSDDSSLAFVTNKDEGTVTIVSIRELKKIKDIATGRKPVSIAFCDRASAAYVASQEDGIITAIDASGQKVVASLQVQPGLGQIKFAPGDRFGFVVNQEKNQVYILETSSNRIIQVAEVKGRPDQITFSSTLAYVRTKESEFVYMIPLDQIGQEGKPVPMLEFPGGQAPLGKTSRPSLGETIIRAPEPGAVLVANAFDKTIYYYKEGMAAPMGNFSNYKREPRAVLVVDRSLKERSQGVYEITTPLPVAGTYDLAFFLDSPRIAHCFGILISESPEKAQSRKGGKIEVETLPVSNVIKVGQNVKLRFAIINAETKEKKKGLQDVNTLVFLAPGVWQNRQSAQEKEEGIYEIEFTPPQAGIYYVYLGSESQGLNFKDGHRLTLRAQAASGTK